MTFPIGISQLYPAYTQGPGYLPGADLYLGDLTGDNFQDLYALNACMGAVQSADQPLASLEFECGDGDYGQMRGRRYDPSAVDFKTRMCLAQGHRVLNYYLFAGGYNYRLDPAPDDGNGRIAITGERHGVAAPVDPEGRLNPTYPRLARVIETMRAVSDKLAVMREEHDRLALAFIPDYFMTEFVPPDLPRVRDIVANLEANRGRGAWESMVRAMLLAGYRFGAVDIQNRALDPNITPVLALASARYLEGAVQRRLVAWLEAGADYSCTAKCRCSTSRARSAATWPRPSGPCPRGRGRQAPITTCLSAPTVGPPPRRGAHPFRPGVRRPRGGTAA